MSRWHELLGEAQQALIKGRTLEALQLCDRAALESEDARHSAALIRGAIHMELGDPIAALSAYQAVADLKKQDADLDCARGLAYFEAGQIPEAEAALRSALRCDDRLAVAHYTLALLLELKAHKDCALHFRRARQLAPQNYPPDQCRTREQFEVLLNEAAAALPSHVVTCLAQFPIVVADLPVLDELGHVQPQMSPQSLALVLGTVGTSGAHPCLLIFKRNVERSFRADDAIVEGIRLSVISEFTRALGLKEDD